MQDPLKTKKWPPIWPIFDQKYQFLNLWNQNFWTIILFNISKFIFIRGVWNHLCCKSKLEHYSETYSSKFARYTRTNGITPLHYQVISQMLVTIKYREIQLTLNYLILIIKQKNEVQRFSQLFLMCNRYDILCGLLTKSCVLNNRYCHPPAKTHILVTNNDVLSGIFG